MKTAAEWEEYLSTMPKDNTTAVIREAIRDARHSALTEAIEGLGKLCDSPPMGEMFNTEILVAQAQFIILALRDGK